MDDGRWGHDRYERSSMDHDRYKHSSMDYDRYERSSMDRGGHHDRGRSRTGDCGGKRNSGMAYGALATAT